MMEFTAEMIAGFLGGDIVGDKEAKVHTVQTIGNGSFILRILQGIIEIFGLLLRHAIVIIACGSQNQIFTGSLVHPFGHHRVLENFKRKVSQAVFPMGDIIFGRLQKSIEFNNIFCEASILVLYKKDMF